MKNMMKYFQRKMKEEKGEVSVEWSLVAIFMASAIALVFAPGISDALAAALATISGYLTGA